MKITISTLIAFSVLGLVAPPSGALDSQASTNSVTVRATERPTEAPNLVRELLHAIVIGLNTFASGWRE
jgi:hypothetical protein